MNKAILETVKEASRIALFAAATALIGWASAKLAGFDPNSTYYVLGTVLLRLADKWIHENDNVALKGISPV